MADEIRNDEPKGPLYPVIKAISGIGKGMDPNAMFEQLYGVSPLTPLTGTGPGSVAPPVKPDISSLTGFENIGQPERNAPPSFPVVSPSTPGPAPSGPTPAAPLPPPTQDQAYRASIVKEMEAVGAMGLLPPGYLESRGLSGGVMKVHGPPDRWSMARKLEGLGETVPEMSRDEMTKALKQGGSVQANIASMTTDRMKEEMDRLGLSYFKTDDAAMLKRVQSYPGAGPSGTADLTNKLYAFLEPKNQSRVKTALDNLTDQWVSNVSKILKGSNLEGEADKMAASLGPIIPKMLEAQSQGEKGVAEIGELQGRTGVHGATIAETPSKIAEREAHAQALLNPPEHGQDKVMLQLHGHIITTGMKELGEAQRMGDKEGIKYWTEKLIASGKAVDAINQKTNERSSANKRSRWLEDAKARPANKALDDATLLAYYDKIHGGK